MDVSAKPDKQYSWDDILDKFFGRNYQIKNPEKAIRMAHSCDHPDAKWLIKMTKGLDVNDMHSIYEAFDVLESVGNRDKRLLYFIGAIGLTLNTYRMLYNRTCLENSAIEQKYMPARVFFCSYSHKDFRKTLVKDAENSGDREAMYQLAHLTKNRNLMCKAAALGSVDACIYVGIPYPAAKKRLHKICTMYSDENKYSVTDSWYQKWLNLKSFIQTFVSFGNIITHTELECYVGWIFRNVIFDTTFQQHWSQEENNQFEVLVVMYSICYTFTRTNILYATFVLKQLGVVRDVRLIITKRLWESRMAEFVANSKQPNRQKSADLISHDVLN